MNDDEGLIRNRDDDYRDARTVPPPEVPADLDGSGIRDSMFVPEVSGMDAYLAQEDFELPRPATLFAPEEERQVRIQRFGDDEWVVAPDPPSVVWPRVKQFLSDNGVAIVRETPETGVLETEWITIEARSYRDVVRATLAQGSPEPLQGLRLRVEQAVRRDPEYARARATLASVLTSRGQLNQRLQRATGIQRRADATREPRARQRCWLTQGAVAAEELGAIAAQTAV